MGQTETKITGKIIDIINFKDFKSPSCFAAWGFFFVYYGNHDLLKKTNYLIKTSIQQFQKGENSEGKNLINFAKKSDLPDYHAYLGTSENFPT